MTSKPVNLEFSNTVAAITGGGGVICGEFALALGRRGAKIALLDIDEKGLHQVESRLKEEQIEVISIVTDVLSKPSLQTAAEKITQAFGEVTLLINGAGGNKKQATTGADQPFFDLPEDAIRWVFDLNFMGTFLPSQVFGQAFSKRDSGSIINISSMNAFTPLTKIPAYSAAKAAVSNFTQWLAVHFAQNYSPNIRVNAMAPGFLLTEQNRFLLTNPDDGQLTDRGKTIIEHTPSGRFGNPEDLVSTLLWLAHPDSAFVNGVVVPVDGGFSAFSGV